MSLRPVLPRSTPIYQFRGVSEFLDLFEREIKRYQQLEEGSNPYVVFGLGDCGFHDIKTSDESLLIKSVIEYDESSQTAIFKIEITMHIILAASFSRIFELWTAQFSELILLPLSTSAIHTSGSSGQRLSKRVNCSWMPAILPYGREYT